MKKEGLSVPTITLIVVLSLVAAIFIWAFLGDYIAKQTENMGGKLTLDVDIVNISIHPESNTIDLTVRKSQGQGATSNLKFLFSNGTGTENITRWVSWSGMNQVKLNFHLTKLNVSELASISVFPLANPSGGTGGGSSGGGGGSSGGGGGGSGGGEGGGTVCTPLSGSCSSFGYVCGNWTNGTCAGTLNCGTLANRPATCSTGQGYWATTQSCTDLSGMVGVSPATPISGTLYKCTSTNVWTAYYTPYTYPHPLTLP